MPSDEQMISISCGKKQVWAVTKNGSALCRLGISTNNLTGKTNLKSNNNLRYQDCENVEYFVIKAI